MKSLSFAAILVTVCAVAACSDGGDSEGDGGAGGGGGASGTTTSSSTSSSTVTTGTGGSGEGGSGEGGSGGIDSGCAMQCIEDNRQGAVEFLRMTLEACGCAEGATCASSCDTTEAETDACGDDGSANLQALPENEACVDCVDGVGEDACLATVEERCSASEGCDAYVTCIAECL
ncbi:hypothetical protein WMF30_18180 [Sorangium sp. So ce134]